jgi:hypothetical protein
MIETGIETIKNPLMQIAIKEFPVSKLKESEDWLKTLLMSRLK